MVVRVVRRESWWGITRWEVLRIESFYIIACTNRVPPFNQFIAKLKKNKKGFLLSDMPSCGEH